MNKNIKKIIIGFIALIVIGLFAFFILRNQQKPTDYILLLNGEPVSIAEYKLSLYEEKIRFEEQGSEEIWKVKFDGTLAEEVAKEHALESVRVIKLSAIEAKNRKITISKDDTDEFERLKSNLITNIPDEIITKVNLTDEIINDIVTNNFLYYKIFNEITKEEDIPDEDVKVYLELYKEENKDMFTEVYAAYIHFDEYDHEDDKFESLNDYENYIHDVYEKALLGEDFYELIKEYSAEPSEENIINKKIDTNNFTKEVISAATNLKKDEISEIIKTENDGTYIIRIEDVFSRDFTADEEDKIEEKYIINRKKNIFQDNLNQWEEKYPLEINNEELEKISVHDFD